MNYPQRALSFSCYSFVIAAFGVLLFATGANAAPVTVTCSGTEGSPTAVTESSLAGDDVTFEDDNYGDNTNVWCELDESISAASVTIEDGVVLTHVAEDVDGVTITTTGNVTLEADGADTGVNTEYPTSSGTEIGGSIIVTGKGCAGGATDTLSGRGPNTGTGICAADTSGYGDGATGNYVNDFGGGAGHGGSGGVSDSGGGGATYGLNTAPILLGSGGGGGDGGGDVTGGAGGGRIRLDVAGTLDIEGTIAANGSTGGIAVNAGGGGSGGSVYITAGTIDGSGNISADGGDGGNSNNTNNEDAGGGGGGRIAVYYDTNTAFSLAAILADAGLKGSGATNADDGSAGTTFILNRKTDDGAGDLRITSGLDLVTGTDLARTNITIDSGAEITCGVQTTLDFTASNNLTDNGATLDCSSAISTFNISAGATLTTAGISWTISNTDTTNISAATWTSSGTNTLTYSKDGATMDWAITNDLTLNSFTITSPSSLSTGTADSGVITMDDAIDVTLVSTDIVSGVEWTGIDNITIDASSSINGNGRGCVGAVSDNTDGYGPNTGTGICAITTSGYGDASTASGVNDFGGGAGHGGAGAASDASGTGATYGSNTAPVLLGSGGGGGASTGNGVGGNGGSRIRLDVTGTLDIEGTVSVDGSVGGSATIAGGGGSGGSVYITTGTLDGGGSISADGGTGGNSTNSNSEDGGGGGGGRIAIHYTVDSSSYLSGMTDTSNTAAGADAGDGNGGAAGSKGTLYTLQSLVFSSAVTSVSSGITVDTLTITLNQNSDIVDGSAGDGLDVITLAASSGTCTIDNSDYAASSTTTLVLNITCSATGDTSITVDPTYTTAGSNDIHDTSGSIEMDNARTVTGTDGAAPVITSFEYQDNDADGKVDTIRLNMTETLDADSVVAANDLVFGNVGDFTSAAFGADATDQAGASGVVDITLGTESSAVDTLDDSGNIAITSQNSFSLEDSAGNVNAVLGAQSQATANDGAGPVLITSSPIDGADSIDTDATVILTFSEAMDTSANFVYTCCGAGTDPGRSGAWTVSDTVYTITPTVDWTNSEDITIDITTADDANTNGFGGAVSTMDDPFTFTIAAAVSGGTPTPGTGPAAVVTTAMLITPNGTEILQGNQPYAITWLASGDNLDSISIYYSSDSGRNYELVASGEANDGSYTWTVPSETTATGKIRVDAVTSSGGVLIGDDSNSTFSVSSITIPPEPETSEPELTGPVLAEMTAPDGEVLDIREGSLFRGVELSGVYLVKDGTRYVFPPEAVFLSRYADFSGVVQIDDDQLRELPFGGRMTMAEGSLIKIQSDNRVYVVLDDIGTITHIPDEATAISTYGADWAQLVHDISVVFWFDYTVE